LSNDVVWQRFPSGARQVRHSGQLGRVECSAALEGVGLDPQIGFLHALRPGRPALALDLMEEFRSVFTDRLALTLVNRKELQENDFECFEGGAVYLNEAG
jgi:CRISPR-associated protein Cas1